MLTTQGIIVTLKDKSCPLGRAYCHNVKFWPHTGALSSPAGLPLPTLTEPRWGHASGVRENLSTRCGLILANLGLLYSAPATLFSIYG